MAVENHKPATGLAKRVVVNDNESKPARTNAEHAAELRGRLRPGDDVRSVKEYADRKKAAAARRAAKPLGVNSQSITN